jgi:hypothetical protein
VVDKLEMGMEQKDFVGWVVSIAMVIVFSKNNGYL